MIVVDVETTGLDPKRHSICEIGAIDLLNPEKRFSQACRIWDNAEIDPYAQKVNGVSNEELINPNKPSLEEVIKMFSSWIKDSYDITISGINPSFDRDFLCDSFERYDLKWPFGYRTVDLHSICYSYMMGRNEDILPYLIKNRTGIDNTKIFQYVGLFEEPKPHIAINGALMEAEAFSRLIHGKGLLDEFKDHPIPEYLNRK